jgi:transposase-like protein
MVTWTRNQGGIEMTDTNILCPHCGSSNVEFRNDDYDYDGNENIWTWDIYLCLDCEHTFNVDTNDPYENVERD